MDVAADFITGIWAVAVEVATAGAGSVGGIGFMGEVWLEGISWAITLTLYLPFTGALALLFFPNFLGTKVFLVKEFLSWEGMLVHGCNLVWGWGLGQACLLAQGTFSSSLLRTDRDRALCSRGCMI